MPGCSGTFFTVLARVAVLAPAVGGFGLRGDGVSEWVGEEVGMDRM